VGGVWPHDTAIAVAGLARACFREETSMLAAGLIRASRHFGHRLPELFCGFDRDTARPYRR
jgi:glycogen debranching enzyme